MGRTTASCSTEILWISYGQPSHHRSHSYGRSPSYRSKERFMLELLIMVFALTACCLMLVYDHLRSRL
jgi:hypothetical protein